MHWVVREQSKQIAMILFYLYIFLIKLSNNKWTRIYIKHIIKHNLLYYSPIILCVFICICALNIAVKTNIIRVSTIINVAVPVLVFIFIEIRENYGILKKIAKFIRKWGWFTIESQFSIYSLVRSMASPLPKLNIII